MGKVIPLNNVTYLDLPPDRILEQAKGKLKSIVILGYEEGKGEVEYFASSIADGGGVLWLLERCKKQLLEIVDEPFDEAS